MAGYLEYFQQALAQGATGTDDPMRAGLVDSSEAANAPQPPPQPSDSRYGSGDSQVPRVLAKLTGGDSTASDLGINLTGGPQTGDYADLRGRLAAAQLPASGSMPPYGSNKVSPTDPRYDSMDPRDIRPGESQRDYIARLGADPNAASASSPPSPPPQPSRASDPASLIRFGQQAAAPQSAAAQATTPSPASSVSDPYGILKPILADIAARRGSDFNDNLLRFGLATMAAGGKPMATTLGAVGEGGISALDTRNAQRAQDLKALLGGAQATNLLSEAGLRTNQLAMAQNLPAIPGASGAKSPSAGSEISPGAPQGPLGPNMMKIAGTLQDLGHNPAQIAGALGWATRESGTADTNTGAVNSTGKDGVNSTGKDGQAGGSYGWQQWLGDRRDALKTFAKESGGSVDDPVVQAKFFDHEMTTPGSGAGDAAQGAYAKAQTPEQAVAAMAHYGRGEGYTPENPQGTNRYQARVAAAQGIYGTLTGSGQSSSAAQQAPPGAGATQPQPATQSAAPWVTPQQAFANGRQLEAAGRKEEAAAWFNIAKAPEGYTNTPGGQQVYIAGGPKDPRTIAAAQAAQEGEKINISRSGAITKGGVYIGHVPLETTVVDAQGNKYAAFTPPMGSANQGTMATPPTGAGAAAGGPTVTAPGATTGLPQPPGAVMGAPSQLGPGQNEALTTRAKEEQETRQKVINDAGAAQQQQASFQNMRNEAGNFVQGPFAPHAQEASRYLRLVSPSFDGQVASYEDFTKNAGIVLRQVTKEVSSREAVQGMQMFEKSLPSTEQSPRGFDRVSAQFMGLNDFKMVKSQAQQQWEADHGGIGNVSGFETDFQKQLTPLPFMFMRMSPQDQAELSSRLSATPDGQNLRGKLAQQIAFVKSRGLDQVLQ